VAGVSASTVSNVLHDRPYVTADKRARVQAAIAQLGYRPSLAGRQLRAGRDGALALAVPDIQSPYFAELAHVLMVQAHERGITLFIDETTGDLARERTIAHGYRTRGITGVIFCPVAIPLGELEAMKGDIPTVLLGEYVTGGAFDHIAIDSHASAVDVAEHLLAAGRRRFAFAGYLPPSGAGPAWSRLNGVRDALRRHGLALPERAVVRTPAHSREDGMRAAELLIAGKAHVDAFVGAADLVSVGAIRAFKQAGVAIPEDVAVVGWDDSPEGRFTLPALASVAHPMERIAITAIDLIERRRSDPGLPPQHTIVPYRTIWRESAGAGPRRSSGDDADDDVQGGGEDDGAEDVGQQAVAQRHRADR
jgi:DNA-binding LacI/PurR family transcriptional regulator